MQEIANDRASRASSNAGRLGQLRRSSPSRITITRLTVFAMHVLPLATLLLLSACQADTVKIGGVAFAPERLEVGEGEPAMTFADLDNDGHQDLVVTNGADDDLIVFLGDGLGGLTRLGRFPAGQNPTDVAAADIDGDGVIDLVVANHETSYLTLLAGDGHGGYRAASNSPLTIDVDPHPHTIRAEDLDGDGHVDLMVDHRARGGLLVLRGLGQGAFETPGTVVDVGGDPYLGLATADVNDDGRLDLVTPNQDEVGVVLSVGSSGTEFVRAAPVPAVSPFGVALADLNRDGMLDVIAASDGDASLVEIFLGNGQGAFNEAADEPFRMAEGAKRIAVGDINGDGVEDALISSWSSDVLVVLGGVAAFQTVRLQLRGIENPWGLAVVDLNEDGKDDFVIADGVSSLATVYLSNDQ